MSLRTRLLARLVLVVLSLPPVAFARTPLLEQSGQKSEGTGDRALAERVDQIARDGAARGEFSGVVLIARDGKRLLEKAYGMADRSARRPNRVDTLFNVASLGKMFTGVAVASLVEAGRMRYEDTVGRHVPDFPNAEIRDRVTVHQLLTHTSGVPDLPDDLFASPPPTLAGYLPFFAAAKLEFEPGAKRAYSNSGFVLLGLMVERVSGGSYRDYVERAVFRRAGMRSVAWGRDERGRDAAVGYTRGEAGGEWTPNTAKVAPWAGPHGGALTTAADLSRFLQALRTGRLVGREAARAATTPRNGVASAYGFGVLDFDTDRLVGHSGGDAGASADAYVYWESGYAVVVLSNLGPPASHKVAGAIRQLIEPRFAKAPPGE